LTHKKNEKWVKEIEMLSARVDQQSMEEIERLGKSDNVEDQIKSLTIFENKYPRLPHTSEDFIGKMIKSGNDEVKQKAEEVYEKTVKVSLEKLSEIMKSSTAAYIINLQNVIPRLDEMSSSFLIAEAFSKQLNQFREMPIKSISESINIAKYIEPFTTIRERIDKPLTPMMNYNSPILTSISYAAPLLEQKNSEATLGQILKRDPEDIKNDLEKVIAAKEDIIFNYNGYIFLSDLERFLRGLIQKKIIEPYLDIIENKIHKSILDEWERRKKEEENNTMVDSGYELIDYSDFTDLKRIFEKGNNLNEFSDLANGEELKGLISKFHELDPIRKKIAHSRALSKREFDKLKIYAEDIFRTLSTA
jgi:hypothetical protein